MMATTSSVYEMWRRNRLAALLSCLLVSACNDEHEPCYGLRVGQQLEVEIVERYDAASQFPGARPQEACPEGFALAAGNTVLIAIERQTYHEALTCQTSHFTVENGQTFGWTSVAPKNAGKEPPAELVGGLSATLEDCPVGIGLRIGPRRRAEDLFAVSEPGKEPYFVLRREFLATESCSFDDCSDEYVVTVRNAP